MLNKIITLVFAKLVFGRILKYFVFEKYYDLDIVIDLLDV